MKIVFLGLLPPAPGGAALSLSQIVSGIARAGHEVCAVAAMTDEALALGGDWFAARHPELRVIRYAVPAFHVRPYEPKPAETVAAEISQIGVIRTEIARSFRPDLVIGGREAEGPLARDVARALGVPFCLWLRGSPTVQILQDMVSAADAVDWLDLYRSADQLIAVADYFRTGLKERFGIEPVTTIANSIDLEMFAPGPSPAGMRAELGLDEGMTGVLVPGLLISRKRPMDLLAAAERVIARNPAVRFLIAGTGVLQQALRAVCDERGLAGHVRFLGWVPNEQMPELYRAIDLVVLPSEAEGVSRVYLEALATERVLVATDIMAAREVVRHGHNGFLVPVGDPQTLAERILALAADPVLCARIGRAGRISVQDRGLDRAVTRYLGALEDLLADHRQRRAPGATSLESRLSAPALSDRSAGRA